MVLCLQYYPYLFCRLKGYLEYLDDFLYHVAVIVANITGIHLYMVIAGTASKFNLQDAAWQLQKGCES